MEKHFRLFFIKGIFKFYKEKFLFLYSSSRKYRKMDLSRLSYDQLKQISSKHPEQVKLVDNEYRRRVETLVKILSPQEAYEKLSDNVLYLNVKMIGEKNGIIRRIEHEGFTNNEITKCIVDLNKKLEEGSDTEYQVSWLGVGVDKINFSKLLKLRNDPTDKEDDFFDFYHKLTNLG
jgi:hypothetical protein